MRPIDGAKLEEILEKWLKECEFSEPDGNVEAQAVYACICELHNMPTLDVAPVVHGKWIEYMKVIIPEPYNRWEQAWKCSECGFDDGFVGYDYCPNCGAIMDLED